MASSASIHPPSRTVEPSSREQSGRGFAGFEDALTAIASDACPHCAKLARAVLSTPSEERTFDASWRVCATASGCTSLTENVRLAARAAIFRQA